MLGFVIKNLLLIIFKTVFIFDFVNINANFIIPSFFYQAAFIAVVSLPFSF
jgi:hypothetical protein